MDGPRAGCGAVRWSRYERFSRSVSQRDRAGAPPDRAGRSASSPRPSRRAARPPSVSTPASGVASCSVPCPRRGRGQGPLHPVEPPPGRERGPSLSPSARHGAARSDPRGQPRPRARGRQVRLAQGVQVLDLRNLLDPPGHRPRARPEGLAGTPPRRSFGEPAGRAPAGLRRRRRARRRARPAAPADHPDLARSHHRRRRQQRAHRPAARQPPGAPNRKCSPASRSRWSPTCCRGPRAPRQVRGRAALRLAGRRKRSYREVGEELGVTAEAARRLVKRAVSAVRDQAADRIDAA